MRGLRSNVVVNGADITLFCPSPFIFRRIDSLNPRLLQHRLGAQGGGISHHYSECFCYLRYKTVCCAPLVTLLAQVSANCHHHKGHGNYENENPSLSSCSDFPII